MGSNDASISKSMAKVEQNTHYGASVNWWILITTWLGGSLLALYPIAYGMIESPWSFIIYFGIVVWWIIFIVYFRNSSTTHKTKLKIIFSFKLLMGKTITLKYVVPLKFLQNIVPLVKTHSDGLIEFTYGWYGSVMHVTSDKIDEDSLNDYIQLVRQMLDSLHDDISLKIISSSYIDHKDELKSQILDLSNSENKTTPQKQHLNELYREINEDDSYVINWGILVFINLGKHKSLADAEIRRQEFIPGFIDALMKTEAYATILTDQNDIAMLYRKQVLVR